MCDYEIKWYVLYVSSDLISLLHDCVLVGPFFLAAQAAQDLRNSQTNSQTNKLTNSHLAKY